MATNEKRAALPLMVYPIINWRCWSYRIWVQISSQLHCSKLLSGYIVKTVLQPLVATAMRKIVGQTDDNDLTPMTHLQVRPFYHNRWRVKSVNRMRLVQWFFITFHYNVTLEFDRFFWIVLIKCHVYLEMSLPFNPLDSTLQSHPMNFLLSPTNSAAPIK